MAWAAKYEGQTAPISLDETLSRCSLGGANVVSREHTILHPRNDVRVALKAAAPALMPAS